MLKFIQISSDKFKDIISKSGDDRKWFIWHLISTLENYDLYKIINGNEIVGLTAISPDLFLDLLILSEFKNKGFGTAVILDLQRKYDRVKYKVNIYNKLSLKFFDSLIEKEILFRKSDEKSFFIYQ